MRIVVIGAGAVGGVIAAYLSNETYQVELVCKHKEIVEAIENNGLRVEGIKGRIITYPDAVIDIAQITDKPDIVFIATKYQDAQPAAKAVLPFLQDDTMVVSLQNGMCEEEIAEVVGEARTVGSIVEWGATMLGPGRVEVTSDGRFIIGELNNEIKHRLFVLKSVLEKIFPVQITSNLKGDLFSKLIINSCITTLGAITGITLGELLKISTARNLFLKVFTEAAMVARAEAVKLEKVAGKIDPYSFALTGDDMSKTFSLSLLKKHIILLAVGLKYRKLKSSSLQSLQRGKATEIDYLNGYIIQKAKKHNIPTPVNERLMQLVKEIENGKRRIELENLYRVI